MDREIMLHILVNLDKIGALNGLIVTCHTETFGVSGLRVETGQYCVVSLDKCFNSICIFLINDSYKPFRNIDLHLSDFLKSFQIDDSK